MGLEGFWAGATELWLASALPWFGIGLMVVGLAGHLTGRLLVHRHALSDWENMPTGVRLVAADTGERMDLTPAYLGRNWPWSLTRQWLVLVPRDVAAAIVRGQLRIELDHLPARTELIIRGQVGV